MSCRICSVPSKISMAWAAGTPLQGNCVLPLSRGGRYTLADFAPACRVLQGELAQQFTQQPDG
jgi:hypothetical protein